MSLSRAGVAINIGFAEAFSHSHFFIWIRSVQQLCVFATLPSMLFVLLCLLLLLFWLAKNSSGSSEMVTHTQQTNVNKYKLSESERRVYVFLCLHLAMAILSSSLFQAHFTNTSADSLFSVYSSLAILEKSKLRIRWKPLKINRINL